MKRSSRVLATGIAFTLFAAVLASCGSATGEATTTTTPAPTQAQTQAPVTAKALLLQTDTVRGSAGLSAEEKVYLSCVQQNRFPQGAAIVWRVKVFDPLSATALDDKGLKSVVLTLPDGTTKAFKYGAHPAGKTDDYFWTSSFTVPADYPTGAFSYKVTATSNEGLVGTYTQFNVAASALQIIPTGTR